MQRVTLPKDTWTEVQAGITEGTYIINQTDAARSEGLFLVTYADALPSDGDAAFLVKIERGDSSVSLVFSNSAAANVYIKSLSSDADVVF